MPDFFSELDSYESGSFFYVRERSRALYDTDCCVSERSRTLLQHPLGCVEQAVSEERGFDDLCFINVFFIIHHLCVIRLDEAGFKKFSRAFFNAFPPDLAATEINAVLFDKMLIAALNVVFHIQRFFGAQFRVQIPFIRGNDQLKGLGGSVLESVVQIIVADAGPHAERDLPSEVREKVDSVMMMIFDDLKRCVQDDPVDEIAQLTQSAPDSPVGPAVTNHETFAVAFSGGSLPNQMPQGKNFTGADQNAGYLRRGKRQVDRLVFLKRHIHIAQLPPDQGFMLADHHGEQNVRIQAAKALRAEKIP